jgi:zinc/manganese transport system permease protein
MSLAADLPVIAPAFAAGLLVAGTHVPLGQEVLKRGIVFLDLALAQVAVLGVILAEVLGFEPQGWATQLAAAGAALAGAWLLSLAERRLKAQQEALIGALFVLAASVTLLLLHGHPHGAEHLKDVLEGQILWTDPQRLVPAALLTAVVLGLWFRARGRLGTRGFYLVFALSVTLSVQLVGVYLVFASLILPALAVSRLPARQRLASGWALAACAYAAGLLASFGFDLPAAPTVVVLLAVLGAAVWRFAPSVQR